MSGPDAAAIPPSGFEGALLALNGIAADGFAGWDLEPGMRFGDLEAWWRPGRRRRVPHEGLDLVGYRDARGRRRKLGAGVLIPAPWACQVAALREDFLGTSAFLDHGAAFPGAGRLHSALGHLVPREGLAPGAVLGPGEVVGVLADPAARGRPLPPHLHLSLALVPGGLPRDRLGWDLLQVGGVVELLDPAALLAGSAARGRR